ncbi:MAG TPA: glycerophosphodiester phosphodiesterase [Thermoflexia bacterium]|nr:glycerophosphodiester phosphodiesterase [Thermoflexia bacterium]
MNSLWLIGGRTLNIAHRGASAVAPQNTLAAFRRAAELGADGVELDVRLSADGVPVVIHDAVVDHTTDGTGRVADLPLTALKELDAGSWFDPAFAGERIPTLDEVFEEVGRTLLINVELKPEPGRDRGVAEAVIRRIERHGLADRVLLSSFDPFILRRARRLAPQIPLGFLYETAPLSRLARLLARAMPGLRTAAIHPHWRLIRPSTVQRAHNRGRRVIAWTVDTPDAMRHLIGWGVDGIITNYPDQLREVLSQSHLEAR